MSERIVVKRYAEGYMQFALENMGQEKIISEMSMFRSLLRDHEDFDYFLKAHEITVHEKLDCLVNVLGADYSQEFKDLLSLLLEKGRIDKIKDIAEYIRLTYAHGDEENALLRTTYPMDLDILKIVKERLEKVMNKKFNLYLEYDPDLLGGVQLIMGNTILDGSVRKRLDELKKQLLNARVV